MQKRSQARPLFILARLVVLLANRKLKVAMGHNTSTFGLNQHPQYTNV